MSGGPLSFDLSPWQGLLYSWYILENRTLEECREALRIAYPDLNPANPTYPSVRTLKRLFAEWGFRKRDDGLLRDLTLQARIWELFHEQCLKDEHIRQWLEDKDDVTISQRQ
jgi:hypothetical protein